MAVRDPPAARLHLMRRFAASRRPVIALGAVTIVAGLVAIVVALSGSNPSREERPEGGSGRGSGSAGEPSTASLSWVGDISLSSDAGLPARPDDALLAGVKQPLAASDLTIGNLEGTLGTGGGSKCAQDSQNCFAFQAPPAYAGLLKRAGFDVMNLANNHAFDYGESGQRQTLAALDRRRLGHTGRPGEVAVRRVHGLDVAFVGFAPYPWAAELRDIDAARRLVGQAARRADVVVVLMHAGAEGSDQTHTPTGTEVAFGEDRGETRRFAHAVVGAGADLVLGSGPHVVRGIEQYRGRLIAYSLGNFLGYHTFSTGGTLSASGILQVRLTQSGGPAGGRWISVRLDAAGLPHVDPDGESAALVRRLSREDFGRAAYPMRRSGELPPPR